VLQVLSRVETESMLTADLRHPGAALGPQVPSVNMGGFGQIDVVGAVRGTTGRHSQE
jgi:hypothetical protein